MLIGSCLTGHDSLYRVAHPMSTSVKSLPKYMRPMLQGMLNCVMPTSTSFLILSSGAHITAAVRGNGRHFELAVTFLQGLPGVSLQWGAWGGSGMAAQDGPLLARLARLGMGAIQPVQGLRTLQHIVQGAARIRLSPMKDCKSCILHPASVNLQC